LESVNPGGWIHHGAARPLRSLDAALRECLSTLRRYVGAYWKTWVWVTTARIREESRENFNLMSTTCLPFEFETRKERRHCHAAVMYNNFNGLALQAQSCYLISVCHLKLIDSHQGGGALRPEKKHSGLTELKAPLGTSSKSSWEVMGEVSAARYK